MRRACFAFLLVLVFLLSACTAKRDAVEEVPTYPWNKELVWKTIDSVAAIDNEQGWMYADTYSRPLYLEKKDSLYWVSNEGVQQSADTLLCWLRTVEREGFSLASFHVDELANDLHAFRSLSPDSCKSDEACRLMGRLEYRLTIAYLRYAFGQRFGYTRPNKVYASDTLVHFGLNCEKPTQTFCDEALQKITSPEELSHFLQDIQPSNSVHQALSDEYMRIKDNGDKQRKKLCIINLERSRWRYDRPENAGDKYVWVNIPTYELLAVNTAQDSTLTMRICCGKKDHQTPLLTSKIGYLELNPYWVIPPRIIKNEIAPHHTGDAGYFGRNKIVAIEKQTGTEVNAASLSSADLTSGRYTLRQEKGEGNSLGRLIFRFPNNYSVYLHDTNSPSAFSRSDRRVSHGCVRVQRPLDLAIFLMDDPNDLTIDKMRIAIDLPPLSEEGRLYQAEADSTNFMKTLSFKPSVPIFLDYYTLYPDLSGQLHSYSDVYGYDDKLLKTLQQF